MHAQFEELIINRFYDLDGLKAKLKDYIDNNKLPADFIYYADDFKKDILAFAQFVLDYDVKPLAVEIALVHPVHNYAGMIDLPCTMLSKPGSKRIHKRNCGFQKRAQRILRRSGNSVAFICDDVERKFFRIFRLTVFSILARKIGERNRRTI